MDKPVNELIDDLKAHIVKYLNLEDMKPSEISEDDPLFGEGLGLDSIDALELVVMLEKEYGIVVQEIEVAREAFQSVRSLANFIAENHAK